MIRQKTIDECTCENCGHVWLSRKVDVPLVCPRCGNRRWNKSDKGEVDIGEKDDK